MSIILLMLLVYLGLGVVVAAQLYSKQGRKSSLSGDWLLSCSSADVLKQQAMRWFSGAVIVMVWPLFIVAELSTGHRYRMAVYIDDELI